jgi:hypothetical protein
MIHFQSDQAGATLRATELKPKLDRFLIKHIFDDDFEKYKEFLIGYDSKKKESDFDGKKAFDYKVKIKADGKNVALPNNFLFFANNAAKDDNEKMHTVMANKVHVEFFSFKTDLIGKIKNSFDDFLLVTNFGARATKGYGSFTHKAESIDVKLKEYDLKIFKIVNPNTSKWENSVDRTHKLLKAGINFREYQRSYLFEYMCNKNIRWEKRKIKQKFPDVIGREDKKPIDCSTIADDKFRYVRAMLGVAGINEYDRGNKTITISSDKVERFASPITYKVVGNDIYLLCDESYESIMDKPFTFSYKRDSFTINTPSKDEFNLYEFLKYVEKNKKIIKEVTS